MSRFMDWFHQETNKIQEHEVQVPGAEVEDGEVVIGVLEDLETKKIFELLGRLNCEFNETKTAFLNFVINSIGKEHPENSCEQETCDVCVTRRRFEALQAKIDLLESLFWICVQHELPEDAMIQVRQTESSGFGIRQDWKIVLLKNREPSLVEIIFVPRQ